MGGVAHAVGKIAGGIVGSIAGGLFGHKPKVVYSSPQRTVMPRDGLLSDFYKKNVAAILGGFSPQARDDYIKSVLKYSDLLSKQVSNIPPPPKIITPFGELLGYGIQRAGIRNVGLLAPLIFESIVKPAELSYRLNYEYPVNIFLKEDLARYGVQSQPMVIQGSPGLLGYFMAGVAKEAAKPITDWVLDKIGIG